MNTTKEKNKEFEYLQDKAIDMMVERIDSLDFYYIQNNLVDIDFITLAADVIDRFIEIYLDGVDLEDFTCETKEELAMEVLHSVNQQGQQPTT